MVSYERLSHSLSLHLSLCRFIFCHISVISYLIVLVMNPKVGASYNITPLFANDTEYELADGGAL